MNMNVNVGFIDKRNSSRVLKPPGGETSDIFGIYQKQNKSVDKVEIVSSKIIEELKEVKLEENHVNVSKEEVNENVEEVKTNGNSETVEQNGNEKAEGDVIQNETIETEVVEKVVNSEGEKPDEQVDGKQDEVKEVKTPNKPVNNIVQEPIITPEPVKPVSKRVPPGGYSSGLW